MKESKVYDGKCGCRSTSEIKISVLIDKKNTKKALIALHKEFKLDN